MSALYTLTARTWAAKVLLAKSLVIAASRSTSWRPIRSHCCLNHSVSCHHRQNLLQTFRVPRIFVIKPYVRSFCQLLTPSRGCTRALLFLFHKVPLQAPIWRMGLIKFCRIVLSSLVLITETHHLFRQLFLLLHFLTRTPQCLHLLNNALAYVSGLLSFYVPVSSAIVKTSLASTAPF